MFKRVSFISTEKLKNILQKKGILYYYDIKVIMNNSVSIHWFRQDLRLEDNPALHAAQSNSLAYTSISLRRRYRFKR